MDVLEDPVPLANLGSGKRMDYVAQIRYHGLAHLLLLCNRCYLEFTWVLLGKCERRLLGLLGMCLAIHTIPIIPRQQNSVQERNRLTRLSKEECPPIEIVQLLQHRSTLFCRKV